MVRRDLRWAMATGSARRICRVTLDPLFLQLAPADLVALDYLQGGELVEVDGAHPSGVLRFRLPVVGLDVTYVVDGSP